MTKLRIKDLVVGDLYAYQKSGYKLAYREEDIRNKFWGDIHELEDGWVGNAVLQYLARVVVPIKVLGGQKFRWTWYRFFSLSHSRNILLPGNLVRTWIAPIYTEKQGRKKVDTPRE